MAKSYKLYQSIRYPHYLTYVTVGGEAIPISFSGATRMGSYFIHGKYGTDNPEIQAELEKSPSFGFEYKVVSEYAIEADPEPEDEQPVETVAEEPIEEPEAIQEDAPAESAEVTVCDAETVQEAKEFLLDKFEEATHRGLSNKAKILQFAIEHNVKLPNIK